MNAEKVIDSLKKKYPEKTIITNYPENPTEIVCEIDPANGVAIAVIDSSLPHHHKKTTENYKIINGSLLLYIDGSEKELEEGDVFEVYPEEVHFAVGNETWVEVTSTPRWTPDDHILEVE